MNKLPQRNSLSDEKLILSIGEGDISCFEILVKKYEGRLFHFVFRYTKDRETTYDILQDTFVSLYKTLDRVDPKKKFSTYLFEIAKNKTFSYFRSKKNNVSLNDYDMAYDINLELEFDKKLDRDRIKTALKSISKNYEKVLKMYFFEELSYESIGKKLKVPVNTVRTWIRRGKKELRKVLVSY